MTTPCQVNTLFGEDSQLVVPAARRSVSVRGNRGARTQMGMRHRTKELFDAWRHPGLVGGAFQDSGPHTGVTDAMLDLTDQVIDQHVRLAELVISRDVVERVNAGRDNDIERTRQRYPLQSANGPAEPDDGEIDTLALLFNYSISKRLDAWVGRVRLRRRREGVRV